MDSTAWRSSTATDRIEELSKKFIGLSDAQKVHMSTVLGSRWQLNRLVILMQAVNNENSYYNKSLRGTADAQKIFTQRQKELDKVLTSNPQMMKQAWVILQNAMTKVIVPLIPHIVYLAQELARLATAFGNLDGDMQKMILAGLIFIAVIGPVARYVGSVTTLFGILARVFHVVGAGAVWAAAGVFKLSAGLLLLPVKATIGLLGMLGGAFAAFGTFVVQMFARVFLGAALASPFRFAMLLMVGTLTAGLGAMMGALQVFSAPWRVLWQVMMLRMAKIWAFTMVQLTAIFGSWAGTMAGLMVNVRAAFASIWVGMAMMMQGVWTAMLIIVGRSGAFMTAAVALINNGILLMQMAWGRAMVAIQIATSAALTATARAGAIAIAQVYLGLRAALGVIFIGMGHMIVRAAIATSVAAATAFRMLPILIGRALMILPVLMLRVVPMMLAALTSPWVLAGLAILGIVYAFRDKIANAWNSVVNMASAVPGAIADFFRPMAGFFDGLVQGIVDAFWALPEGVRNAMVAVLTIVQDAALAIYDWFSYINPFARHSPSLVENVERGMDAITGQFARMKSTGSVFQQAYRHLNAYKKAMGGIGEFADDRQNVAKGGGNVQLFDAMTRDLNKLYPVMRRQEQAVGNQERVTDRWANKLDEAADRLNNLQQQYDQWTNQLEAYADAPLKGMGQMQEQIDANTNAQNKLNLAIMKWEQR